MPTSEGANLKMYGVPGNLNLTPFVGCTLDQIRIGAHQISFHFSGPGGHTSASLDVESKWLVVDGSGAAIDQSLLLAGRLR